MAIQPKEIEKVDNTIVGESILINGKLEGDEDLTVRGRVMGSITLTKTLIVEPSGVVKADAVVRNAVISGVVVGNISASESVHLTHEGRMVGDINSPRVIIVEGAAFRGRIDMGEVEEPRLQERAARPQTVAPAASPLPTAPAARPQPPAVRPMVVRPSAPASVRPTPPPAQSARSVAPPPRPPPAPVPVPARPTVVVKPAEQQAKPPPPPPPPKPSAASDEEASAPVPMGLGKRKVVVKRKK